VGFYQKKPCVQGVINVSKFLLNALKVTLTILAPIFGSPDWGKEKPDLNKLRGDAYNTNALHPDDEYLGDLKVTQSFGDIAFGNSEDTQPKNPATIIAGPEGAQCIVMSRSMWMGAHAMEPVRFLRSMPMFAEVDQSKLQKLAVYMVQKPVSYRQKICSAGASATHVYLVKAGQLSVQILVDEAGDPLPLSKIAKVTASPPVKKNEYGQPASAEDENPVEEQPVKDMIKLKKEKRYSKEVALIGLRDAYDDGRTLHGELLYPADVVAASEDVVVYELPRKNLEKVMGSEFKVHPKAILYDRRAQREEYTENLVKSSKETKKLMEAPITESTFGEWLGWTGYRGLPNFHKKEEKRGGSPEPVEKADNEKSSPSGALASPCYEVSPALLSPNAQQQGFLPAIDAKRRHHQELMDRAVFHYDNISQLGKKGSEARAGAVEYMVETEKSRFRLNDQEDMDLQSRVRRTGMEKYIGPRGASAMGRLQPQLKGSEAKTRRKAPRRSHTSLATHPALGGTGLRHTVNEWPCRDGAKQVVKLENLGRRMNQREKQAYERKLRMFVPPTGGTLAAAARGRAAFS